MKCVDCKKEIGFNLICRDCLIKRNQWVKHNIERETHYFETWKDEIDKGNWKAAEVCWKAIIQSREEINNTELPQGWKEKLKIK